MNCDSDREDETTTEFAEAKPGDAVGDVPRPSRHHG